MGVDQSKKRLGLKTGVEKGMFRPEIRSGVGLSLKYHTSPLPNPWGTRGRESQTIYTPRSRVDQEHARRASSEAARNKGGSPKKKFLLSPLQSLLLITSNLHCNANDCLRSTATLPPIPPSPVLVRCCLFSQNGKCSRKQRVLRSFRIWSQISGFKRRVHRRHLSSSNSVRLSYVRSLPAPPDVYSNVRCPTFNIRV